MTLLKQLKNSGAIPEGRAPTNGGTLPKGLFKQVYDAHYKGGYSYRQILQELAKDYSGLPWPLTRNGFNAFSQASAMFFKRAGWPTAQQKKKRKRRGQSLASRQKAWATRRANATAQKTKPRERVINAQKVNEARKRGEHIGALL